MSILIYLIYSYARLNMYIVNDLIQDIAQSGSASALGAEGRRFKSCYLDISLYMYFYNTI